MVNGYINDILCCYYYLVFYFKIKNENLKNIYHVVILYFQY